MSGGALDYFTHKLQYGIDDIESHIKSDFKYEEEVWKNDGWAKDKQIVDQLSYLTPEQREKFVKKAKSLVKKLKKIEEEVHTLEWCLSGDYSLEDFIK